MHIAWEWSFENFWNESWYADPDTGQTKSAFINSAEFVGRPIKDL